MVQDTGQNRFVCDSCTHSATKDINWQFNVINSIITISSRSTIDVTNDHEAIHNVLSFAKKQ